MYIVRSVGDNDEAAGAGLKLGSLCTGYGGLDMAVERYFDAKTVWVSEIDKYASQLIDARINKPNLGNLKVIDWASVEPIDVLTAGYPCQPFSHAGHRKGVEDERHLWPYIKQAISVLRPKFVVLENVRGHFSLGFREVLGELTEIGYDARWRLVRASDVGAPHRRERLFIVAYPNGKGSQRNSRAGYGFKQSSVKQIVANTDNSRRFRNLSGLQSRLDPRIVGDTYNQHKSHNGEVQELGRRFASRCEMFMQAAPNTLVNGKLNAEFVEYMMGLPKGWVTDVGLSRTQQLKILGNGVVPQQAYYALQLLLGQ